MRFSKPLLCLLLAFGAVRAVMAQEASPFFHAGKVRALIFSGRNNHDWRTSTPHLEDLLTRTGHFDVRVVEEPAGTTAATLAAYEVIVLDYMGPRWGDATEHAVANFVKSGKGLVVVHGASYAFTGLEILGDGHKRTGIKQPPWPEYLKMIGGYWTDAEPKTGHGQYHSFKVKVVNREHPITRGMKESFLATDELYHRMKMQPEANVLARAYDDPNMDGTGQDEPILWTVEYGQGRIFHTTLGHDLASMQEPGFIESFLHGAEWAATANVTLPAKMGHPEVKSSRLRILAVTGGHDYPPSFYTLFEGAPEVEWQHAATNHEAFKNDIRDAYDALVLYDFTSEITEAEKKNLVNFVENGKGVVVIHHAIADYQDWEWWWREVVGGKYLLKPAGNTPGSTYMHDQEIFAEPVGNHPILRGISRMHIWDETYKGMWISPGVNVILRTNHPTSDGPLAWISAYDKSRVVHIQLGHDHLAHRHPAYRKLVRNAILWSGKRLEAN